MKKKQKTIKGVLARGRKGYTNFFHGRKIKDVELNRLGYYHLVEFLRENYDNPYTVWGDNRFNEMTGLRLPQKGSRKECRMDVELLDQG
jgi:hypothetical protein